MELGNAWQRKKPFGKIFRFSINSCAIHGILVALGEDYHKEWYIPM